MLSTRISSNCSFNLFSYLLYEHKIISFMSNFKFSPIDFQSFYFNQKVSCHTSSQTPSPTPLSQRITISRTSSFTRRVISFLDGPFYIYIHIYMHVCIMKYIKVNFIILPFIFLCCVFPVSF